MIAACVTPSFGILATDSAAFNTQQSVMSFETMKLFCNKQYLITFMGTPTYFAKMDHSKLNADLPSLCLYMEDYLKKIKPEVEKALTSEIANDDNIFCLFILGIAKKLPTLVQFNSELNFKPKYLFSSDKPKFSTIFSEKKKYIESTEYMEKKTHKLEKKNIYINPGIMAEVLTRGIYKKADIETEKFTGGAVNLAGIWSSGAIFQVSGMIPIGV